MFITQQRLDGKLSSAIRDFYNTRNFEYTWFSSDGLIEQSLSFRSLYSSENDSDQLNKSLEKRLDDLKIEETTIIDAKAPSTIKTELQITQRFIRHAWEANQGFDISPASLATYIPAKKRLF